jgi:hypothetical protein
MTTPSKIWLSSPHMSGKEQEFVNKAFATNDSFFRNLIQTIFSVLVTNNGNEIS